MNNAIAIATAAPIVPSPSRVLEDWLASKKESTRRAYAGDIRRYADWRGMTPNQAIADLIEMAPFDARRIVLDYRAELAETKSAATVNRALAALRSVVDLANDTGLIVWTLNVKGLKARAYRDTAGPKRADVSKMIAAADAQGGVKGARDGALIRLLYGLGLRRSEAIGLRLCDVRAGRVWVQGKGKDDRAPITMPTPVVDAMNAWLKTRPEVDTDAVFCALDRNTAGAPLSDRSVARVVKRCCELAGIAVVSPHALRHSAITTALEKTGGDVRKVRAFSRHSDIRTVVIYDDNRTDGAAEIAELVSL